MLCRNIMSFLVVSRLQQVIKFDVYVTFHGKTYINGFPFNGLKRLLVVCLPLKRFTKSLEALEHLLKFSL